LRDTVEGSTPHAIAASPAFGLKGWNRSESMFQWKAATKMNEKHTLLPKNFQRMVNF
jgi:hypothetical protein